MRVSAGIVSFNPDVNRIIENLNSIEFQVEHVYVFDNGSENIDELRSILEAHNRVTIIPYRENAGIAFALNRLCDAAREDGFSHIVTLDQDSVSTPGMVDVLVTHAGPGIGIVAPQIVDRNKEGVANIEKVLDHKVVNVCEAARKGVITSGCLMDLSAHAFIGGFDESFFIDYVDYDFNKRLLLEGYKIIRVGDAALIHECGNFVPTWLWTPRKGQDGKWRMERFYSFGHSPFRCYYKSRNRILYSKKYKGYLQGFEGSRQILPQIALTLLFEKDRGKKLAQFIDGIRDGRAQHVDPYKVKHLTSWKETNR